MNKCLSLIPKFSAKDWVLFTITILVSGLFSISQNGYDKVIREDLAVLGG